MKPAKRHPHQPDPLVKAAESMPAEKRRGKHSPKRSNYGLNKHATERLHHAQLLALGKRLKAERLHRDASSK